MPRFQTTPPPEVKAYPRGVVRTDPRGRAKKTPPGVVFRDTSPGRLYYLASPYSHPDPSRRAARFQAACQYAAGLMREGLLVYSPIAHSHPIAAYGLPVDREYWERLDRAMLARSDALVVLRIDGWRESKGVQAEIKIMLDTGKPVIYAEAAKEGER